MSRRNLPLVELAARRFAWRGEQLEDLVQVGTIGLINAVDRFDPGRGASLTSFALAHVVGEIRRHLRDRCATIRIPRAVAQRASAIRSSERALADRLGRSPTTAELSAATGLDAEALRRARTPAEVAPLPEDGIPDRAGEAAFEAGEARVLVTAAARELDARKRRIVQLHFFGGLSQREIARELGISQVHVTRLLHEALVEMRAALDGEPARSRRRAR